eukprot:4822102-Prymnesium_polylepis.2
MMRTNESVSGTKSTKPVSVMRYTSRMGSQKNQRGSYSLCRKAVARESAVLRFCMIARRDGSSTARKANGMPIGQMQMKMLPIALTASCSFDVCHASVQRIDGSSMRNERDVVRAAGGLDSST